MLEEFIRPIELNNQKPDLLLINVPATFRQGIIPDDEEPPFGLLRIATLAEQCGHKVAILDAHKHNLKIEEISCILSKIQPFCVGLNPTSVNINESREIAELCSEKNIEIILGGVQTTLDPIKTLQDYFPMAKLAIKGEGESVISQVIDSIKKNNKLNLNGIYYKESDPKRIDFTDHYSLNKLPLVDQSRWIDNPLTFRKIKIKNKLVELREISLYETSGCPFDCTFCASPSLHPKNKIEPSYHRPTIGKILESTKMGIDLGANAIHFVDDMAFTAPKHFYNFAEGIKKFNLKENFYWRGMTRVSIISNKCSNDDLSVLRESGCWRLAIGVESGDQKILDRVRKRITLDQVRNSVSRLRKAGIPQIKAFFIMGFPEETMAQMEKTKKFIMELKDLGLTHINLFQFKPYPGTQEWKNLEKNKPELLSQLFYNRKKNEGNNKNNIINKKINEGVWLPDNLKIASVNSKVVKDLIIETIEDFYND